MEHGEGLRELNTFMNTAFPMLLHAPASKWNSLDIDYEPPRVERLWVQLAGYRASLHVLHPGQRVPPLGPFPTLYHPHQGPSAIRLLRVDGAYEMAVGAGTHMPNLAMIRMSAGSEYEMLEPHGWHYVRIIGEPVLSVMLTWPPFDPQVYTHTSFGKGRCFEFLSEERKEQILTEFRHA